MERAEIRRTGGGSGGRRGKPKGRAVEPSALGEVQALLGSEPRRRDLLIEHLHKIQDTFGHVSAAHIAALAREMKLSMTEVFEVASFYHHFDIVKEGETPPPPLTPLFTRLDTLAAQLPPGGSHDLRHYLQRRSYEKARLWLEGVDSEKGTCRR